MNDIQVDENLKPTDDREIVPNEFLFLAEMLAELTDIELVLKSFQNKILIENIKIPYGEEGIEQRIEARVKYNFYNQLRTEIYNFKKRKASKKR